MTQDNRTDELLVLFRETRRLPRPTRQLILKQGCAVLLLLTFALGSTIGLVRVHKRHVAKEFLETLYTVTEADLIDPKPRVECLYTLAEKQFVDGLLSEPGDETLVMT